MRARSLSAYLLVLRKPPYTILLSITFGTKKTKKTDKADEGCAAPLRPSTTAETAVDGKAVTVGCEASASIKFVLEDLPGVKR